MAGFEVPAGCYRALDERVLASVLEGPPEVRTRLGGLPDRRQVREVSDGSSHAENSGAIADAHGRAVRDDHALSSRGSRSPVVTGTGRSPR